LVEIETNNSSRGDVTDLHWSGARFDSRPRH